MSNDPTWEDLALIELGNVGFRYSLLFVAAVEDCRSVLSTFIGSLAVELSGIMRN